jgi:hypothetical protein
VLLKLAITALWFAKSVDRIVWIKDLRQLLWTYFAVTSGLKPASKLVSSVSKIFRRVAVWWFFSTDVSLYRFARQ